MKPEDILFDIDGLLVDSNGQHVETRDEAFRGAGHSFDRQVIHDRIGKGGDTPLPTLLPDLGKDAQEEIGEAHGKAFETRFLEKTDISKVSA